MKKLFTLLALLPVVAFSQTVPTVTLSAATDTLITPITPTLTWSSTGVASCVASSSPSDTKWTGPVATSGTLAVTPILVPTTYTLTCTTAPDTTATLTWTAPTLNTDGTTVTNLSGFKVYEMVGTTPTLISTIAGGTVTSATVPNLSLGTHTFYVTAYNSSGVESAGSNQGSKTIVATQSANKTVSLSVQKKPAAPASFTVN